MNHTINRVVGSGRVAVILCWAAFLAFSWYSTRYPQPGKPGRLEVINPSYRWLSLASAAALISVGAALLPWRKDEHARRPDRDHEGDHEGDHDHEETGLAESCCQESASPGELVFQALFLAPIVLSLCTTGSGLSGSTLARRGIHELRPTPAATIAPPPAAGKSAAGVQPPLTMDDLNQYLMMGSPEQLVGRDADLVGQYFVDDRCGENQFLVTRIVITCCLADADVIGLRVQPVKPFKPGGSAAGSSQRPDWLGAAGGHELAARTSKMGPWIAVSGKLRIANDRLGNPALFVENAVVSEVPAPGDILLYTRRRGGAW